MMWAVACKQSKQDVSERWQLRPRMVGFGSEMMCAGDQGMDGWAWFWLLLYLFPFLFFSFLPPPFFFLTFTFTLMLSYSYFYETWLGPRDGDGHGTNLKQVVACARMVEGRKESALTDG
jgi:hypothetical protein